MLCRQLFIAASPTTSQASFEASSQCTLSDDETFETIVLEKKKFLLVLQGAWEESSRALLRPRKGSSRCTMTVSPQ
ncbi:hypothetical protein KM043_011743 [Ampulex compressa]|nr:hypothetical protein KM043_011743 [Ampulex compressa]